jgi:hypothetical protein
LESTEVCRITKTKGLIFKPTFRIEEIPLSIHDQRNFMGKVLNKDAKRVSEIVGITKTLPINAVEIENLKNKMKKLELDYFIDPQFPPTEESLYDG